MARDYLVVVDHRCRFVHRGRIGPGSSCHQQRRLHTGTVAGYSAHYGCGRCSGFIQHLWRKASTFGRGHLLLRPHVQLRAGDRLPLGHDADQAECSCGVHAVYR